MLASSAFVFNRSELVCVRDPEEAPVAAEAQRTPFSRLFTKGSAPGTPRPVFNFYGSQDADRRIGVADGVKWQGTSEE
jgi:hypothetical protein